MFVLKVVGVIELPEKASRRKENRDGENKREGRVIFHNKHNSNMVI